MKKKLNFDETKEKMIKKCHDASISLLVIDFIYMAFILCILIGGIVLMIQTKNFNFYEAIASSEILNDMTDMIGFHCYPSDFCYLIILNLLAILLIETDKKQTPFTNKNVKILKIVDILVVLLWLFGHIGIIIPVMTTTFYWIFKYGCFLQKDSDETL